MNKSAIPLAKLRTAFEVYNQTTGKSPSTYHWYSDKLALFERFLGKGCQLSDFTRESAREFIAHLQGRRIRHEHNRFVKNKEGTLSSSYIQGFARGLRAFSSWLHAEGYTDTNVLKTLKPPRIQTKVVQVLTEEEIGRILSGFDVTDQGLTLGIWRQGLGWAHLTLPRASAWILAFSVALFTGGCQFDDGGRPRIQRAALPWDAREQRQVALQLVVGNDSHGRSQRGSDCNCPRDARSRLNLAYSALSWALPGGPPVAGEKGSPN
jgi:hypothetical protein